MAALPTHKETHGGSAARQKKAIKKELAKLTKEMKLFSGLKYHVETIVDAYNGIIKYQKGNVWSDRRGFKQGSKLYPDRLLLFLFFPFDFNLFCLPFEA